MEEGTGRRNEKKQEKEGKNGIPPTEISKCGTHCTGLEAEKN